MNRTCLNILQFKIKGVLMKITWKGTLPLLAVLLMLSSGCNNTDNNNSGQSSQAARDFSSDVPTAWFKLAYSEVKSAFLIF